MCGRYTLISNVEAIRRLFEVPAFDERLIVPRYNIAPTQPIVIVRAGPKGRELMPVRWGLIPHWAKDPATLPLLINARAEGLAERPAFRDPLRYRRCLIPASGFYEWQARGRGAKQPYFVRPDGSGGPIAFAGLWETWHGADGSEIDTAAIVTTEANAALEAIHARMPVVIDPRDFAAWLSPATGPAEALTMLRPAPDALFTAFAVSSRVNSADNDDSALIVESHEPSPEPTMPKRMARKAPADPRQESLF
jgi:putative SOS response-associated peptidase YedK